MLIFQDNRPDYCAFSYTKIRKWIHVACLRCDWSIFATPLHCSIGLRSWLRSAKKIAWTLETFKTQWSLCVPAVLTSKTSQNFKNSVFLARVSSKHYWALSKNNFFESHIWVDLYLQCGFSSVPIYIQNTRDKTWKRITHSTPQPPRTVLHHADAYIAADLNPP